MIAVATGLLSVGPVTAYGRAAARVNVSDYRTDGRSDAEAIQAAISAASPGDTVYFEGGVYELDKPFFFGSGVRHVGEAGNPPVLRGMGSASLLIDHTAARPLKDSTIRGLHFDNIHLRFKGATDYDAIVDLTIVDCQFENGAGETVWNSDYVTLSYTNGVTIDNSTFLRSAEHGGRGVVLHRTRTTVVKDSHFGTTRNLESDVSNGYFRTAINLMGFEEKDSVVLRNEDVLIDGNVWRRTPGIPCPDGAKCEDHGMYGWGAKHVYVVGNYGDGWTTTAEGGSLKMRNGDDYYVLRNHFRSSGILTYMYPFTNPAHLHHERIEDNRIDMLGYDKASSGIFYRRTDANGSSTGTVCEGTGIEDDIFILGNKFVNGGNVDIRCAVGNEICVEGNTGGETNLHVDGVTTAGCEPPGDWDAPMAGVHRGDFNGDGKQDFVHYVAIGSESSHWRAHLSDGDGYVHQNWGENVWAARDTEDFGVHVADFDGDGKDDLVYYGLCGSERAKCWRMHKSTGNGFLDPRNAGNLVEITAETLRFGFHTGDFDGDGRADIVFRSRCEATACWRVLSLQPDGSFSMGDWGNDVYWDPDETDEYGLQIGDFNGDGRDDIAYLGRCGSTTACMRAHISTAANVFAAQRWGSKPYLDGSITPHFGMRVVDHNGDGKDDIAYRGKCGNPGVPVWRFYMGSAQAPATVACSPAL
ncbi:VCBS repeat-containing protein [Nonomuraea sp. B19D2]|uniref:FG-GAP repeat domain-containing protein n=1 Tax=Nonomuraea sp. B19D2 TaxID=3159561 RepID=UPI0032DBB6C9